MLGRAAGPEQGSFAADFCNSLLERTLQSRYATRSMLAFCPKEPAPEARASADPESVKKLVSLGLQVAVEAGIGLGSDHEDAAYAAAGAAVTADRHGTLASAG